MFYAVVCIPAMFYGLFRKLFRTIFNTKNSKHYNKIAIFQFGHFGDLIHMIPLLKNLKLNNPNSEITLITLNENSEILKIIPFIDNVIFHDHFIYARYANNQFLKFLKECLKVIKIIRHEKFDLAIDLKGHIDSLYLLYASGARMIIGFNYAGNGIFLDKRIVQRWDIRFDVYEKDRLLRLLDILGYSIIDPGFNSIDNKQKHDEDKNIHMIGIFPGAPQRQRRWPAQKYAELADAIIENNLGDPIILGGEKDAVVVNNVVSFMKKTAKVWIGNDIIELVGKISQCNCFISNDTGPMHLAVALGVRTVALFSSGNYKKWGSPKPNMIIRVKVACSPCKLQGNICGCPHINCMETISIEEVMNVISCLPFSDIVKKSKK